MTEVKFACPICGQHITCDAAKSGLRMPCPTCYRQLVVPEAPSGTGSRFILAATEAQTRPAAGAAAPAGPAPTRTQRSAMPFALAGILLLGGVAAAFVWREKLFHRPAGGAPVINPAAAMATNSVPSTLKLASSDADQNWRLDLAAAHIPDAPVSGRVHGFAFTLDRATITGGILNLRQGPKWPPDLGVTLALFAERAEDLAGKHITIEAGRTDSPKVTLRWKHAAGEPATATLRGNYALRLEFGAVTNQLLPGRLFLAVPDPERSFVAGTFQAEIRRPAAKK